VQNRAGEVILNLKGGHMGVLLLIAASFAIMGGFHVIAYCALGCAFLFVVFILPSMAISKLFRA
jgi:hypothetical protein